MNVRQSLCLIVSTSLWLAMTSRANAHCDTMDGPVIKDAQSALVTGRVTGVLKWIQPQDEREIITLFEQVQQARSQGEPAKTLAETYFFESLVRLHRAGEGAPYTGLKPSGQVEPIIAASDQALDEGTVDELIDTLTAHMAQGIRQRFQETLVAKEHIDSVDAGRAYVRAYVGLTHYIEALHTALAAKSHVHD